MFNKLKYALLITCFACISCDSDVYREYNREGFSNLLWAPGHEVAFKPEIKDISKPYTLTLAIRHAHGLDVSQLKLTVATTSPSGKESKKVYSVAIKDKDNSYLASCAGDICDLEKAIEENITFEEQGTYTYRITHNQKSDPIPNIMEVGLIINEKKEAK